MATNAWFMSAEVGRDGTVRAWEYPAGVTLPDLEFMARTSEILPAVRASLDGGRPTYPYWFRSPGDSEATGWMHR
jgi:hypothetical protein